MKKIHFHSHKQHCFETAYTFYYLPIYQDLLLNFKVSLMTQVWKSFQFLFYKFWQEKIVSIAGDVLKPKTSTCSSTRPQSLKRHLANFINKLKLSRQIFNFGILHQINGQFVSFNSRELKMLLTSPHQLSAYPLLLSRAKSSSSLLSWQMTGFLWRHSMSCQTTPS